MNAELHSRTEKCSYYRITSDTGNPLTMVRVTTVLGIASAPAITFEILAEAYPSERKSILAAVIAAMP